MDRKDLFPQGNSAYQLKGANRRSRERAEYAFSEARHGETADERSNDRRVYTIAPTYTYMHYLCVESINTGTYETETSLTYHFLSKRLTETYWKLSGNF